MLLLQSRVFAATKAEAIKKNSSQTRNRRNKDIPVITMAEDYASQAAIAAVQGGDGIYEHVIPDDTLTTIQAAEAAGMADLREHANPKVTGNFETEVPGWHPGQIVTIDLPDRGVNGEFWCRE